MWCLHDLEMANVWRSGQNAAESLSCSDFHCTDFRYQQSGTASAEQVSQLLLAKTCLSPVSRSFTSLSYPYFQRQVLFPVTTFSALQLHSSRTTSIIVVIQAHPCQQPVAPNYTRHRHHSTRAWPSTNAFSTQTSLQEQPRADQPATSAK